MEWIARKLDGFIAGVVIAVLAIAAAQSHAFMTQYIARLGGDLETARAQLNNVRTGLRYRLMSDTVRSELEAEALQITARLEGAYDSVARANAVTRPVAFARHADPVMVTDTWRAFVPELPRSPGAISYALIGMLLGFAIYELIKLPVGWVLREPRRRKFRRR